MSNDLFRLPFGGMPVHVSPYAEVDGPPVEVRRTWRERLCLTSYAAWCSQPFEPWRATRTEVRKVPGMFQLPNMIVVHPALMPELRRMFGDAR